MLAAYVARLAKTHRVALECCQNCFPKCLVLLDRETNIQNDSRLPEQYYQTSIFGFVISATLCSDSPNLDMEQLTGRCRKLVVTCAL